MRLGRTLGARDGVLSPFFQQAKAEYIALSSSLHEVIPLMTVMDELNEVYPLLMETPQFYCKVWEDNQSCIAMATSQKFTLRMKHIALKYHHFKGHVKLGRIQINYIHTECQSSRQTF